MKCRPALLVLSLLALASTSSLAGAQALNNLPAMTVVTIPGSGAATLAGELPPGGRALYTVQAKAGQTLMVSVMPVATGLSFQVFATEASVARGGDGLPLVTGRTLPDAGPADNAQAWIGAIPGDGSYLVLLARQPASTHPVPAYNLTFSLR
jgi:hypothetical protein